MAVVTPMVLVLMSGRPNTFEWAADNMDAIPHAWYPGTMGGLAVGDVLVGDRDPSGKLPITFPRTIGQVPIFYSAKNTGRPSYDSRQAEKYLSRYLDTPNTARCAYGHGLGSTRLHYGPVTLDRRVVLPGNGRLVRPTVSRRPCEETRDRQALVEWLATIAPT